MDINLRYSLIQFFLIILFLAGTVALLSAVWIGVPRLWKKGISARILAAVLIFMTPSLLGFLSFATFVADELLTTEKIKEQIREESDDFYRDEFLRLTKIQLPKDAQFIRKASSRPDFFGDYNACFTLQISASSVDAFIKELGGDIASKSFSQRMPSCILDETPIDSEVNLKHYDLTSKATREEALVGVTVNSRSGLIRISWSLW